jgi:hypothetical protein
MNWKMYGRKRSGPKFVTCLKEESKATKEHPVYKPMLETRSSGIDGKNTKHTTLTFYL